MKKSKNKSQTSVLSSKSEIIKEQDDEFIPPLDVLTVKVHNLKLFDEEPTWYYIRATFFDQLILNSNLKASGRWEENYDKRTLIGTIAYDPSDYEKICLFADCPLSVTIQPLSSYEPSRCSSESTVNRSSSKSDNSKRVDDVSCCNVDILPLFLGKPKMHIQTRMQPLIKPSALQQKSWGNLPLVTMELEIIKDYQNKKHHELLENANLMSLTLIGAYNMPIPFNEDSVYTAATTLPLPNESNTGLFTFNNGYKKPKGFNSMSFYSKWESLRLGDSVFTDGNTKFICELEDIQNESNIDLLHYLNKNASDNTTVWGSFHRTLVLENSDNWLRNYLRCYKWPFEVHIYEEKKGLSFMAFLDLFRLLCPGDKRVVMAVPLEWFNPSKMAANCNCDSLLTPNDQTSSIQKLSKTTQNSTPINGSYEQFVPSTGADENCAFIIVEVKLAKPLVKISIPPTVSSGEINDMLSKLEEAGPEKRECSGRGQLDRDWQSTVRNAVTALRKVPYHGTTDFCAFNRQLSETRTRVEITTSCWLDAAVYVNNNFIVQNFLKSENTFEEMLMMAHACLMQTACDTILGVEERVQIDPIIRAARHARQMQDVNHAINLYLQYLSDHNKCANTWRELATCLLDVDRDWANVCIDKSISLDPRHPLTLLSKACMIFDERPADAEPFFLAILSLYPFWSTGWTIVSAYYNKMEYFYMADKIIELHKKTASDSSQFKDLSQSQPRNWEYELGDWWDYTPLLPGQNRFYDAADLLLRLRAITMAEICVSRALIESGETAAYYHLVALCCRLRGDVHNALCHLQNGIQKFDEISYLRSIEGECYHKTKNVESALASFEKASNCSGPYCTLLGIPTWEPSRRRSLLVDLVRRQPSAYSWMALADDWIAKASVGEGGDGGFTDIQDQAKTCAVACAVQALKWDRRAGRAWALISSLVKPSARRLHCRNMALACGYNKFSSDEQIESQRESKQSLCYHLGTSLRECQCVMCENIQL